MFTTKVYKFINKTVIKENIPSINLVKSKVSYVASKIERVLLRLFCGLDWNKCSDNDVERDCWFHFLWNLQKVGCDFIPTLIENIL